jgi:tetratricopeptide (TPR) repeat protein
MNFYIFILINFVFINSFAQPANTDIVFGIKKSLEEDYESALTHFETLKKEYPNHPAGYFFSAAVYQSMMMDFETLKWEDQFYQNVDQSINLAKKLENSGNIPPDFYYGGSLSYKSFQLGRNKKYPSAIKVGLRAIHLLEKAVKQDSQFCDPYLGIGSYQYWRSRMTSLLSWLPFFPDQREQGIKLIKKAADCSVFSRWAALSNIAWIYIYEEEYENAINYASIGLDDFPSSRFFLWPFAEAHFRNHNFIKARNAFTSLLKSVQAEKFNNHYNEILLFYKRAQCHYELEDYQKALEDCETALALEPSSEVKSKSEDKKNEIKELVESIHGVFAVSETESNY